MIPTLMDRVTLPGKTLHRLAKYDHQHSCLEEARKRLQDSSKILDEELRKMRGEGRGDK